MYKKILHILPEPSVGGMELVAIKLAAFITDVDHVFCFLYQKNNSEILDLLKKKGFSYYILDKKDGIDFFLIKKIYFICRKEKINIIHCRNFSSSLYGSLSKTLNTKVKIISDIRGIDNINRRVIILKLLTNMHLINKLICVSNDIKNKMLDFGFNKRKVEFIANGVDLTLFNRSVPKKEDRCKYKLPLNKIIIGTVGRLEKVKNYSFLIKVFANLSCTFDNVHLVIVGEGSERSYLRNLSQKYKTDESVTFLGYQEDIPSVMNCFDVFVSTSLSEGMSNVIMEAMASKLTVIATNVGGTPELIEDGESGLLFKSGSEIELFSLFKKIIESTDLRVHIGKNAYEKIEKNYSFQATAKKYIAAYSF